MEMIVIYNMGRDAAAARLPGIAPDRVDYPARDGKTVNVALNAYAKREWLLGYATGETGRLRRSLRAR